MTDQALLDGILAAVHDVRPLECNPPLHWQVSTISPKLLVLWDARVEAEQELAAKVAREFGKVLAMQDDPIAGILVEVADANDSAGKLRFKYSLATNPQSGDEEPIF